MALLNLTEAHLNRLPALADREGLARPAFFWDPKKTGLGVRLNKNGGISWVMKARIGNRPHWKTLGQYPEMKPKEAKEAWESMKSRIKEGKEDARLKFSPELWERLVDRFSLEHLQGLKKKTRASYKSALQLHVRPAFKGRLVHEITEADVKTFHETLGTHEKKERQANVCLMLIGMIFERAEAWRHRPLNTSPVVLLRKGGHKDFTEGKRDRPLEDEELTLLGEALMAMEAEGWGQFCDFVRVLYFSGARRGEVLGLMWDWINVERKKITWPDSKTGETSKPLNDALFEVLAGIPRIEGVPWVFPTQGTKKESASGHLEDVKRPWKRMLKLAGIADLTRHDLRHNVGNQAADEGENLQTVAALLGHKQTSTAERYSKTKGLAASNRLGATLKKKLGSKR